MRWAEVLLFFTPFLLFAAWRVSVAYARPSLAWGALGAALVLVGVTAFFGLQRRAPATDTYVPARILDGTIVPGRDVPK